MKGADSTAPSVASVQPLLDSTLPRVGRPVARSRDIPVTSRSRQRRSLRDCALPLDGDALRETLHSRAAAGDDGDDDDNDTLLYLGYGSNLSAETFLKRRKIRPRSQVNVVVPALSLSFDLPGVPYSEPCFANVRYRDAPDHPTADGVRTDDYHKDRWPKGLVGVAYEVTRKDFAHIIATEGGGAGYQDVLVECYALTDDPADDVPWTPTGDAFKAHTLFDPGRSPRPDHSYAQPSARYLQLITDGADEHGLPLEYQAFLRQIRPYSMSTTKQRLGAFIFLALWGPFFSFAFGGASMFLGRDGIYPKWLVALFQAMFRACWASYDIFFRRLFGDGERTIGDDAGDDQDDAPTDLLSEKVPLVESGPPDYGSVRWSKWAP